MFCRIFDNKTGSGTKSNKELPEGLGKPIIKIFKRRKVYAKFKDTSTADLAEMSSLSSFDQNFKYFLYVIGVSTKYAWVKPFKDKKTKTVLHGFIEIVNKSKHKPNKSWVDQGK